MLNKLRHAVLLLCLTLPVVVKASGTFISFPPPPKSDSADKPGSTVDCDLPENADNEACK